jgi:hypothetical protein
MDWDNKEQVLIEVSSNGMKLRHASKELKNDKEVVITATSQMVGPLNMHQKN